MNEGFLKEQRARLADAQGRQDWALVLSLCHEVLSRGTNLPEFWAWAAKSTYEMGLPQAAGGLLARGGAKHAVGKGLKGRLTAKSSRVVISCSNCGDDEAIKARFLSNAQALVSKQKGITDQRVLDNAKIPLSPMQASVVAAQLNQLLGKSAPAGSTVEVLPNGSGGWTLTVKDASVPAKGTTISWNISLGDQGFVDVTVKKALSPNVSNHIGVVLQRLPRLDLSGFPENERLTIDGRVVDRGVVTVQPGRRVVGRSLNVFSLDQEVTAVVDQLVVVDPSVNTWAKIDLTAVTPDEQLRLDGTPVSNDVLTVPPGTYTLTRMRDGHGWTSELVAHAGVPTVFDPTSAPWPIVRVVGLSKGIRLVVNGQPGQLRDGALSPAPGEVKIDVYRAEKLRRSFELTVAVGETQDIVLPGRFVMTLPEAEAAWELELNGEPVELGPDGRTVDLDVNPKQHTMRLRNPMYEDAEYTWMADPGSDEQWTPGSGDLEVSKAWSSYESQLSDSYMTYMILGGGGVLALGALGAMGAAIHYDDEATAAYTEYHAGLVPASLEDPKARVRAAEGDAALAGNMAWLMAAASAGVIAWAVYRFVDLPSPTHPAELSNLQFSPMVTPTGGGIMATWSPDGFGGGDR